jgi:hypothetical protein
MLPVYENDAAANITDHPEPWPYSLFQSSVGKGYTSGGSGWDALLVIASYLPHLFTVFLNF